MKATSLTFLIAVLASTLIPAGCLLRDPLTDSLPDPPPPASLPGVPGEPSLDVLVLGDWGTGEEGQVEMASAMASAHGSAPPAFVLTVGDNFYPDGVKGVDDSIWQTHFEEVYTGSFWEGILFQGVLGNHDHHGEPDAQVAYSRISTRWRMPARYYAFQREIPGGGSALFLALDTDPVERGDSIALRQWEWADSVLSSHSAEWVVVAGHHPVLTGGWHGPARSVQESLLPLLGGRADVYVSGHNHSTELLSLGVGSLQAVCGGGGGLDNAYRVGGTPRTLAAFTNGGWCSLRFWPEVMAVELFDRKGRIQFRHVVRKRRAGGGSPGVEK